MRGIKDFFNKTTGRSSGEFNVSERVSLLINKSNKHSEFVPRAFEFKDNQRILEQVSIAIRENMPVLLIGDTGSGKTSLVRYLADKTNNAFRRVNHNGGTTTDDIVGRILVNEKGTYWVDGVLVDAMRKGYWYLADEINIASPEINFVYHSLLDDDGYVVLAEKDGEVIRPHPNFKFFGAMNPPADYAGSKEMNKALLSRFLVVKTDFPEPKVEREILKERTGVDGRVAKKMVKFANEVRSSKKIDYILSTRDLIMWAFLYEFYKRYIISAEMTILNKVDPGSYESVKDLLTLKFKKLDNKRSGDASGASSSKATSTSKKK